MTFSVFGIPISSSPLPLNLLQSTFFSKYYASQHFAALKSVVFQCSQRLRERDTLYIGVTKYATMLAIITATSLEPLQTFVQNNRAQLLVLLEHPCSGLFDRTWECDLLDTIRCFRNLRDAPVELRLRDEELRSLPHVPLSPFVDDAIHEYDFAVCANEAIPILLGLPKRPVLDRDIRVVCTLIAAVCRVPPVQDVVPAFALRVSLSILHWEVGELNKILAAQFLRCEDGTSIKTFLVQKK